MSEDQAGLNVTASSGKRRGAGSPLISRPRAKTRAPNPRQVASRAANASRRSRGSRAAHASRMSRSAGGCDTAPPTETIDVGDNRDEGEEDVVDLTCEGSDTSAVVDLTNNDSVLLVDEGRRHSSAVSYVLSSDDEEAGAPAGAGSRWTPGMVSCPVCMDSYSEMVGSGRLVVSTKCGHVFCSHCLKESLKVSHTCPTCRKKLTPQQYHPLYI
ncbi:E3 ubiquitin-protein ligase RNF4 [Synchiropus picturatus]